MQILQDKIIFCLKRVPFEIKTGSGTVELLPVRISDKGFVL